MNDDEFFFGFRQGGHSFVFVGDEGSLDQLVMRSLAWAWDPELTFEMRDAFQLAHNVKEVRRIQKLRRAGKKD